MTQDERWVARYNEVKSFVENNKRRPSKYTPEERNAWNWLKANRKAMNAGKLKPERMELFQRLLAIGEQYKHVNQYA